MASLARPLRPTLSAATVAASRRGHGSVSVSGSRPSSASTSPPPHQPIPPHPAILPAALGPLKILSLNRPDALNSLNLQMVSQLTSHLVHSERSPHPSLIILNSLGRAFCAGGDVIEIAKSISHSPHPAPANFFKKEYELDAFIAKMSTPLVSFLDGIAMGGGLGLAMHSPFRVATENTRVAMPETAIGLFPDVGATFFLPRMDGQIGTYLGLTGTNLSGWAAYQAGFATHYLPSESLPDLQERLLVIASEPSYQNINKAINEFSCDLSQVHSSSSYPYQLTGSMREAIDLCFGQDTVENIIHHLHLIQAGTLFSDIKHQHLKSWAEETIHTLNHKSPTSLKLTLMALREGARLNIDDCFRMEMRIASACTDLETHTDFLTGVNHLLVAKLKSRPPWSPASLKDVTLDHIKRIFFSSSSLPSSPESTHPDQQKKKTHPQLEMIDTKRKTYDQYPYPIQLGLPSENLIKDVVIGNFKPRSDPFSLSDQNVCLERILSIYDDHAANKVGLREKVLEVLERKTFVRDGALHWRH